MKKILLVAILGFGFINLNAQNPLSNDEKIDHGVIYPDHVGISRPLREIWAEEQFDADKQTENELNETEAEDKKKGKRKPQIFVYNAEEHGEKYGNDQSIIQTNDGTRPSNGTKANFAGIGSGGMYPYDPSGAAGTNYYVQAVNATTYKVCNKTTGATITSGQVGNLWSPATGNLGDPIVMYDRFADRWFISQFGNSNRIYIAISTTNDPTGSYYTYSYTSPQFPDYLKFSIWRDGYYMTANTGTQRIWAFERAVMLTGGNARSVYQSFSPPQGGGFFVPMPGDADGTTLPTSGGCPIFSYTDNAWGGGNGDAIRIYNAVVSWSSTASMTITQASGSPVATSSFDASYDFGWDDISQPGTTQKLDGIGGILQYRAQFRVWSGYNSVVLNWPVKISSTQRSIMWAELRQSQSTGTWSVYQQGIYTPDAYSRWVGSIAMDDGGNIALCYAKSGASTVYPSLGYTGRLATDPLGQMTFAETIAIAGTGSQTGGINRFGDYAQTTLDPDGMTFWHTGMYMGGSTGSSAGRTRIYSFQLSSSVSAGVTIVSNDADNSICNGTSVTFTATPLNGGTSPSYQWKKNGGNVGTNSATYTTSTLANGDVITCVMTSNLPSVLNNPATSNSITMTVNNTVTPAVSISTTGGTTICSGTSKTFTASPTNGGTPSYQWKKNGGNVGTNSANYTTSTLANGDVISCVMTSNAGCVTSSTATSNNITVTVNATPATPVINSNSPLCQGETITLTTPTVSGATYSWTSQSSWTSSQQNPNLPNALPNWSQNYYLTITVNGCTSLQATEPVVVNSTPATPTISANGNVLTSSSATGNQWYLNGNLLPGETGQNITVTQAGNYTVVVTTNGCSSASSAPFASTVSINELENPYFLLVYPNPTEGDFNISFKAENGKDYTVEMFNEIGQVVLSQKVNHFDGTYVIPVSMDKNAAGVYTIRITNGKTESVKKIVVNK